MKEVIITNSQKKEQKAGGPFQSFAILPIQRVPRYVLLLDAVFYFLLLLFEEQLFF